MYGVARCGGGAWGVLGAAEIIPAKTDVAESMTHAAGSAAGACGSVVDAAESVGAARGSAIGTKGSGGEAGRIDVRSGGIGG